MESLGTQQKSVGPDTFADAGISDIDILGKQAKVVEKQARFSSKVFLNFQYWLTRLPMVFTAGLRTDWG